MDEAAAPVLDLVVVTGPHRSGTTFVASLLAAADRTVALGVEPLNVTWGMRGVDQWYPEVQHGDEIDELLQRLRTGRPVRWRAPGDRLLDRVKSYRRGRRRNERLSAALDHGDVVVLKDPFLSASLGYATRLTSRPVIATLRHPSAWFLSLQRVDWHPGPLLESVAERPRLSLVADELGMPRRAWSRTPLPEAAAWAWSLLVGSVVRQGHDLGDAVRVMPLEQFEDDPVETAMSLIDLVGLEPGIETRSVIESLTLGSTTMPSDSTTHVLQRNTSASLAAWRSVISPGDRQLVWDVAEPVARQFYEP